MDLSLYLPLLLASLCVGLSKGGLPGIGMIAVPMLALKMSPIEAAALLLPIFILSDIVAVYLYRHHFDKRNLKIMVPAGLIGVAIGGLTASVVSETGITFLIGLLGIGFCLKVWLQKNTAETKKTVSVASGYAWGTLSGFTSFVAHAGAPPYQVYMLPQKLPRLVFAGTTTIVFAAVNLAKIIPYSIIEPYGTTSLKLSMTFLPVALLGTVLGKTAINKLGDKWFYRVVQCALFIICIQLVIKSMQSFFN